MRLAASMIFVLLAGSALAQPTPPPPGDFPPDSEEAPSGPPGPIPPPGYNQNQAPPPGYGQAPPPGQGGRMSPRDRFAAANVTRDGRLTREQAGQARWMPIARHFDEIDTDHKGYVTMQDIREWSRARRAARQQYQGAPQPGPQQ